MQIRHRVLLLLEVDNEVGRQLIYGIAKYSNLHSHWIFYCESNIEKINLLRLKNWGADGIIAYISDEETKQTLMGMSSNIISVGMEIPGAPHVESDNGSIAEMACEHFINKGFRNFVYFGNGIEWSLKRQECFCEFVKQRGFEINTFNFVATNPSYKQEFGNMVKWLKRLPKPIAVMACNDEIAIHVIEVCRTGNFSIPDEVAILGVENDEVLCAIANPPLSSIKNDLKKAGYDSAELLNQMMNGNKDITKKIIIKPQYIVERVSTDTMFVEDADIANALRFIRENSNKMISVDDVVKHVALSRRVLEKRFRSCLNRTINSEIKQRRIDQITRLLLETNWSVSKIASELGYPGFDHIARFFRREKGMSLLKYRKSFSVSS